MLDKLAACRQRLSSLCQDCNATVAICRRFISIYPLKDGGDWKNPNDVMSKQSILAKHLFFYSQSLDYDLKSEAGRQTVLEQRCHVLVTVTLTPEGAREMEGLKEQSVAYQFVGVTKTPKLG